MSVPDAATVGASLCARGLYESGVCALSRECTVCVSGWVAQTQRLPNPGTVTSQQSLIPILHVQVKRIATKHAR